MLNYIEYLKLPSFIAITAVIVFLIFQVIGEILEFKGKVVPEIFKVRKWFARKKEEKRIMRQIPSLIEQMQASYNDFLSHYSQDNISMRNHWIAKVDQHLVDSEAQFKELREMLDQNSENTLQLLVDSKRKAIIDFASYVIREDAPVTREQFNRAFKIYKDYESLIEKNGLTNGEATVSHRIIMEAYEQHVKNHSFIEDIRGYDM